MSAKQIIPIQYNIIQAPMAEDILTPQFVATGCLNGMLGCIPAGIRNYGKKIPNPLSIYLKLCNRGC